jgi:hypothetical protein
MPSFFLYMCYMYFYNDKDITLPVHKSVVYPKTLY